MMPVHNSGGEGDKTRHVKGTTHRRKQIALCAISCGSTYLPLKSRFQRDKRCSYRTTALYLIPYTSISKHQQTTQNNMSDLPKYSRSGFDTSETESLVKGDRRGSLDGPAAYPPQAGSSSNGLANITYSFIPQWPVPGKRTNVLGVLGRDTEVCHHHSYTIIAC